MAYVLNQYNYNTSSSSSNFMTYITDGTVMRKSSGGDNEVLSTQDSLFEDECILIPNGLSSSNNYYFHGKIKRMESSDQVFNIKLMKNEASSSEEDIEQFIKSITIAKGDENEWVDFEFIFTPYDTFDLIMFELKRTAEDYRVGNRYPKIVYEELSIVNNIIPIITTPGVEFIKIGVQSRPGLLMCINGEEIRIGRAGIYEFKNGVILINFFSVVAGGAETGTAMYDAMNQINVDWAAAELIEDLDQRQAALAAIQSVCFFGSTKTRTIDSFTLDYLYREE